MNAFAAVFAREVAERRMVFLVGLGCGLPMLVASALHGWNAPGNAEVRLLAASVGGLALAVALALLYGASMIAGETAEKRISFYFSRPVPPGAIWAGKLLAAVFLSLSAGLLVFLPGWLTGPAHARGLWGFDATAGTAALAAVALVTACVLAAHAVVTVARLKSPWAVLDLVLAIGLTAAAAAFLRALFRDSMDASNVGADTNPAALAIGALVVLIPLALALGAFAQVAVGRTDARRAHGAFSTTLWGVLGIVVLSLGLYTGWGSAAKATDLERVAGGVSTAHRGPWTFVGGPVGGGRGGGSFLFDTASGRSIRVHGYGVTFSQDGTRAAWGEPELGFFEIRSHRVELIVAELASGRVRATGIITDGGAWIALSPSGRRVASWDGGTLAAWDVKDPGHPRQLGASSLQGDRRIAFVDEDTIRAFPRLLNAPRRTDLAPASLEITELSLPSKKSHVTGRLDRETLPWLRLSADGRSFVGTRRAGDDPRAPATLSLLDGRTGAPVATLAEGLRSAQARFLAGNRLVVAGIGEAGARALFFEGEKGWGAPARTVDLGPAKRIALGGELAPQRVAIALFPFEENPPALPRSAKLVVANAASGAVSQLGSGLVPADRTGWWLDPVMTPPEAGASWTSLFLDPDGRLVRLDPATGAQTLLLGKGK